jgi:outer membrane protein assembly factor BamB
MSFSTKEPTTGDWQYVHPAPLKTLSKGIPTVEPNQVHNLIVEEKGLFRSSGEAFVTRYLDGRPFEAQIHCQVVGIRGRYFLRNKDGEAIGVTIPMLGRMPRTLKIYGFEPYTQGQKPSKKQLHEGKTLYPWAEVVDQKYSVQTKMTMADGTIYIANRIGAYIGAHKLSVTRNGQVCASLRSQQFFRNFEKLKWDVIIGPGIDPCLIIAFVTCVNALRKQNK